MNIIVHMNVNADCVVLACITNLFLYQMSNFTLFLCFRGRVVKMVINSLASLTLKYKLTSQSYRNSFVQEFSKLKCIAKFIFLVKIKFDICEIAFPV